MTTSGRTGCREVAKFSAPGRTTKIVVKALRDQNFSVTKLTNRHVPVFGLVSRDSCSYSTHGSTKLSNRNVRKCAGPLGTV